MGSRLSQIDYQPELYEQYGSILLKMNDEAEAGLYLFLSGADNLDYPEAIEIFLNRHGSSEWQQLIHTFPRKVKKMDLQLLPENVRKKLIDLGARVLGLCH